MMLYAKKPFTLPKRILIIMAYWCYALYTRILGFQMPLKNFVMSVIAIICQIAPALAAQASINQSEDVYVAFYCAELSRLELAYEPSEMPFLREIL